MEDDTITIDQDKPEYQSFGEALANNLARAVAQTCTQFGFGVSDVRSILGAIHDGEILNYSDLHEHKLSLEKRLSVILERTKPAAPAAYLAGIVSASLAPVAQVQS